MPKPSVSRNSSGTNFPITGGIRGFMLLPTSIPKKVEVIARLKFELAYFETAIQHISHNAMGTPPPPHFKISTATILTT